MRAMLICAVVCAQWPHLVAGQSALSGTLPERPNIILIMADDMGYSDLGCYGGEIRTPRLDSLAARGLRFTNFYNAGRCCPTRASLLTGVYPHQAGIGGMVTREPADEGPYQGYLSAKTVTLAEVLSSAGYYTSMSGKWHVGEEHPNWPMDRGFDDYYGLISGAANYFDITRDKRPDLKRNFAKGNTLFMPSDSGFYMTDAITGHAVQTLEERRAADQPFFMYVAYTAPHYPLHALPDDIAKYKGRYHNGWDSLRAGRFRRMRELGIADKSMKLTSRDPLVPSWNAVEDKPLFERKMEVYAAQVDRMDQGIGKILDKLREIGKADNTLLVFLSDNGGTAEGGLYGEDYWKNGLMPGDVNSYQSYGRGWAHASNTPFSYYKQWMHEGGIATPLIAWWPNGLAPKGAIIRDPAHVMDIMATFVELAGADYPTDHNGNQIIPLQGISLAPYFAGSGGGGHEYIFWEHSGNMAVIRGRWKLVSRQKEGTGKWALHDLHHDRAEQINLAGQHPEIAADLLAAFRKWALEVGVVARIEETFQND